MIAALNAAGGLALFILAMAMMTDGLKVFGGQSLKTLLRNWTSSAPRGVMSGALVTAIVQSSSAVTVATIGFVNAGVLTLRDALGVIFGTNIGTTMTGWLVSIVGFGFKIEAFALPILALGVATRMIASGKRYQGLGDALAGFGLFFLGLAILKDSFSGFADMPGAGGLGGGGDARLWLFVLGGFAATVITQSSSAAIAITLTAAGEAVISVDAAAAAIIGANIGTTSTAVLAVIGATPSAKRVAAGHVVFNVVTGIIALSLLPGVLWVIELVGNMAGFGENPVPFLALFHTIFNLLGVALLLPFAGRLATFLERFFHTAEEDLGRPVHLDKNVAATPVLAVSALREELVRLGNIVSDLGLAVLREPPVDMSYVQRRSEAMLSLGDAIAAFVTTVRMEDLPRDLAQELSRSLRISRYLEEAARLSPEVRNLNAESARLGDARAKALVIAAIRAAEISIRHFEGQVLHGIGTDQSHAAFAAFNKSYQDAKSGMLEAAALRHLSTDEVDTLLDRLRDMRRMVEQVRKADDMLKHELAGGDNHSDTDGGDTDGGDTERLVA